jgi:hypothetical protein
MNHNKNKAEVIRQKILARYFCDGGCNMDVFWGMDMQLPHAIAWIGRDPLGISLIYQLAMKMPCLFELGVYPLQGKKQRLG